jgi:thaumarchaeosortase
LKPNFLETIKKHFILLNKKMLKGLKETYADAKLLLQIVKEQRNRFLKALPLIAFAVPLLWLYSLEPASFEAMWKGRTFQLFFIWLIGLELIMGWGELHPKLCKLFSARTIALAVTTVLPTLYVVASYYWGVNQAIFDWSTQQQITWANTMALSTEYLAFGVLFFAVVYLGFGFKGIKAFSVPAFFLILVGAIYTIDNVFPYGQFTPFQIFVPTTANLAAAFLNLMGYTTNLTVQQSATHGTMTLLTSTTPATQATATFEIAWPCAGIESFLIFTVVILLFLKRMPINWKSKIGYFAFGAAVTYVINSFRIVNIFLAGMAHGEKSPEVEAVHLTYGPLYAIAWIVSYPLIIILAQTLWQRHKKRKQATTEPQPASPNPA